tara:strand:+ start:1232 stop:1450 length:219 start_codon:yes stop_codon:yes gene_type:complete
MAFDAFPPFLLQACRVGTSNLHVLMGNGGSVPTRPSQTNTSNDGVVAKATCMLCGDAIATLHLIGNHTFHIL